MGTTVCIYFPRAAEAARERVEPDAASPLPTANGLGRTLLLVEDEATIREVLATCAREAGYRVLEASDGASALAVLHDRPDQSVDLIVTDVGLPGGMNGRQFAGRARASRPAVRILFITGYAESVISTEPLGARMHLMVKPFELSAFLARLAEILDDVGRTSGPMGDA